MGRVRNILDLGLAIGAIAGSVAVLSPQMLWGDHNMRSLTSAQAVGTQESLPLAQFIGIGQFVKTPTNYRVVVGEKVAKVTDASLDGDRMVIEYAHTTNRETTTGQLTGTINDNGIFTGVYQAPLQKGLEKGNATFTFEADGTAKSSDSSADGTRIFR